MSFSIGDPLERLESLSSDVFDIRSNKAYWVHEFDLSESSVTWP